MKKLSTKHLEGKRIRGVLHLECVEPDPEGVKIDRRTKGYKELIKEYEEDIKS